MRFLKPLFVCLLLCPVMALGQVIYQVNSGVNLRKGPDNEKRVLTTIPKGRNIEVIAKTNEWWWEVRYDKHQGYVANSFISVDYPATVLLWIRTNPYIAAAIAFVFLILVWRLKPGSKKKSVRKTRPNGKKAPPRKKGSSKKP